MDIIAVETAAQLANARRLIEEYVAWLAGELGLDLAYQDYAHELAHLPGPYAPPAGRLVVAYEDDAAVGCGALRPLGDGVCELKRMYLRPEARGGGRGRALAVHLLATARAAGYRVCRLDTLAEMQAARALYHALGFRPIAPYYDVPPPIAARTVFMELELTAAHPPAREE